MRRSMFAVIAVAWLVTTTVPAAAGGPRVYEGTTSQGARVQIELHKRPSGAFRVKAIRLKRLILTCELDASIQRWGVQVVWGGAGAPMDGRSLDLDLADPFSVLQMDGRFGALRARGGVLFSVPQLTDDGRAQLCTSNLLTWTADRTIPAPNPVAAPTTGRAIHRGPGDIVLTVTGPG
jgi:hypothetical protein